MRMVYLVVGLLVVALLTTGCSKKSSHSSAPSTPTSGSAPVGTEATSGSPGATAPQTEATPEEPPEDPEIAEAQMLTVKLLHATESDSRPLEARLKQLGDKSVSPLLAALVQGEECRPNVLQCLHELTGFQGKTEFQSLADYCQRQQQPEATGVPRIQLAGIFVATEDRDPNVQQGALRYLRQLGFVGEDRIAVADACWWTLQTSSNSAVHTEAWNLRREQTDLAVAMINGNLLAFQMPILGHTTEWLAHLGADAACQGLLEPEGELRIAKVMLAGHEIKTRSLEQAAADARRAYFDEVRANVIENARVDDRARRPYWPANARRPRPAGVHLSALNNYLTQRNAALAKIQNEGIESRANMERAANEQSAAVALQAIEAIQMVRDARMAEAELMEGDGDLAELLAPSLDSPVYRVALTLSERFAKEGKPTIAHFWANEALAYYKSRRDIPNFGLLRAAHLSGEAAVACGAFTDALLTCDLVAHSLVTRGDYLVFGDKGDWARLRRAAIESDWAQALEASGRPLAADFHRRESLRFQRPFPDDATFDRALEGVKVAFARYEAGEYAKAVDELLAAREILDPPTTDALFPLIHAHLRLGHALRELGRYEQALCLGQHGYILAERKFGKDQSGCAPMLLIIGAVQRDAGQLEEAEATMRRSEALYARRSLEADEPTFNGSFNHHFGLLRVQQGRPEEGRSYLEIALRARSSELGVDHRLTQQTQQALDAITPLPGSDLSVPSTP